MGHFLDTQYIDYYRYECMEFAACKDESTDEDPVAVCECQVSRDSYFFFEIETGWYISLLPSP